jgi:hypothetical protein
MQRSVSAFDATLQTHSAECVRKADVVAARSSFQTFCGQKIQLQVFARYSHTLSALPVACVLSASLPGSVPDQKLFLALCLPSSRAASFTRGGLLRLSVARGTLESVLLAAAFF